MDLEHGILLFIIGTTISVVGMGVAYYIGSKDQKKELPNALKELFRR